jgi:TonB family protein
MPKKPKDLMLLAARTNGLRGDEIKPWHLKASFTALDESGNAKDQGTIEEFWVSSHQFKTAYTSSAFTQTDYGTENGVLRVGPPNPESILLVEAGQEFAMPGGIVSAQQIREFGLGFDLKERIFGGSKLLCLSESSSQGMSVPRGYVSPYCCLDADQPIIRVANRIGDQSQYLHENKVSFQGRYLPGDLQVSMGSRPVLKVHLDLVELLTTIKDADFTPPTTAVMVPTLVILPADEGKHLFAKHLEPQYPPMAHAAHIYGTVVLQAEIGTDGRVLSLYVVDGPEMLRQAALDAVWKWTFKPYSEKGNPMEVITTINVPFPKNLAF